jgi:hypothetical protein
MHENIESRYKEKKTMKKQNRRNWKNERNTVKCNTKRKQKAERHN